MPSDPTLIVFVLGGGLLVTIAAAIVFALRARRLDYALAEREERLQMQARLAAQSREVILIIEAGSGRIQRVAGFAETVLGQSDEKLLGTTVADLLVQRETPGDPSNPDSVVRAWNLTGDVEVARPSGEIARLRVRAERWPTARSSDTPRFALFLEDDFEQQRAKMSLQRQNDQLRSALELIPNGVVQIDGEGRVVWLNESARRFLNLSEDAATDGLVARMASRASTEDGYAIAAHDMPSMRALRTGRRAGPTLIKLRFDDEEKWVQAVAVPIRDSEGDRPTGAISVFQDVSERRTIQRALESAEDRYRRVFERNPQPMWVYDQVTLRFVEVNDAAVREYGYSREEFLSMTIEQVRPADERPKLREVLRESITNERVSGPWRHQRKDGTILYVEIFSHGIRFNGRPARFVLASDVTERERALEALRESEERHRLVTRLTNLLVYDYDIITSAISWSGAAESVLGESLTSMQSVDFETWAERIHPDERVDVLDRLSRSAAADGLFRATYRMRRKDGSYTMVLDTGRYLRDANGVPYRMLGTLSNISEQIERERVLVANEERVRLAAGAAHLGVWDFEISTGAISWLGRTSEIFGLTPDAFGANLEGFLRYVHEDDRSQLDEAVQTAIAKGIDLNTTYRWVGPDGRIRWIVAHGTVIHDSRGRADRMVGVVRDITDQREADKRQRLMMAELDHRVKNNLAAVATIAEQTLSSTDSMEEFRAAFTGRLIALARTHEALARSRWEGIDLHQAVELVLGAYLMSDPPRIRFEGDRMHLPARAAMPVCLAIHELATNAVKYGALANAEGEVRLRWWREDDGSTMIEWREQDGPTVKPPAGAGMGRRLIEGLIVYELRGEVDITFPPGGVVCRIRLQPPTHLDSEHDRFDQT